MSDELKPCAHCGESAELCCPSGLSWWVRCSNTQCGMATKIAYSPEPVVSAWNRRADAAIAKREAVAEEHYSADATSAREFQLIANPDPAADEWIMQWSLLNGTVLTRTSIKISGDGLLDTIKALGRVARQVLEAASQQAKEKGQ